MADKAKTEIQETPAVSLEPAEAPAKPKSEPKPKAKPAPTQQDKVTLKRKKNPKAVFKSFLPK